MFIMELFVEGSVRTIGSPRSRSSGKLTFCWGKYLADVHGAAVISWYAGVVRGRGRRDAVMTTQQCRGGSVVEQGRRASCRFRHLLGWSSRGGGRVGTTLSWRACLCSPHLLYIVPAQQGPTTQLGWAPLTKEPSQGPDSVVGPSRWRSILTKER